MSASNGVPQPFAEEAAVPLSCNVKDAALNLNTKAFELRRTLAAVWDLNPSGAEPPAPEAAISLDMKNEGTESVVGEGDERVKVGNDHFAPGGKYRCESIIPCAYPSYIAYIDI